jgi:hypothetical protein
MHGASLHTVLLGFRFLQKQPLYAGLCILNLALGIGGVAAVFGVADPIVFRTLDVRSPQDLILVGTSSRDTGRVPFVPMGLWQRLREQSATLTDAMAQVGPADPVSLGDGRAATDEVRVGWVSDNFLSGLGVPVQLGRVIDARDRAATERTVVISDRLWRRRFGGDRDVPGRRISLDLPIDGRTEITIVGVAAPGFAGVVADFPQDAWLPIAQAPGIGSLPLVQMLGRPEDGISREEIVTEINYLFAQMDEDDTRVPYVESGSKGFSSLRSTHAQPLLSLGGLTALILMVACANVVALQLVTNGRRQQALATRMALGAPPLFIAMEIVAHRCTIAR